MPFGENRKKDFLLKDILEFKTVLNEFLQGKFIFVKFSEIFLIVKISFNWLLHVLIVIGDFSKHSWSAYPVGLLNTGYYNQMLSGSPAEAICLVPTLCHTLYCQETCWFRKETALQGSHRMLLTGEEIMLLGLLS